VTAAEGLQREAWRTEPSQPDASTLAHAAGQGMARMPTTSPAAGGNGSRAAGQAALARRLAATRSPTPPGPGKGKGERELCSWRRTCEVSGLEGGAGAAGTARKHGWAAWWGRAKGRGGSGGRLSL
jgi:hypothetical protein